MYVNLNIERFDPDTDKEPRVQTYTVEVTPEMRVLDALMDVTRNQDGSLGFRKSCAHGVCGSDAMIINGKERLACKTLVADVANGDGDSIEIKPLRHLPVQRDLLVDQTAFFAKYKAVQPYFIAKEPKAEPNEEVYQSQDDRAMYDEATKCILCGACYSACPILDKNPNFIGPAAIVQAARFINDSRDMGLDPRLSVLDSPNGVWPCDNHFECTKACPREIKITKLINQTKRQIKKLRKERGEEIHDS